MNRREKFTNLAGHSSGLFGFGSGTAQIGPINIGTKVFAADLTVGYALDFDTSLSRNAAASNPVINDLRHKTELFSKPALASADLNGALDWFHMRHYQHVFQLSQHMVFVFINTSCNLTS